MVKQFKLLLIGLLLISASASAAEELVVYSARNEQLIKPIFDVYEKASGTRIKFITDKAAPLLVRLKAEGKRTPADILITVDAGNLWKAAHDGVLQSVNSKVLKKNIPTHLRDPGNQWFGFSVRARTIVYSTKRVKPSDLSTYEALGSPKWKGRLCLRTSKKVYNQSLVAMMIARLGKEKTEKIIRSWVSNLATKVFSNDTSLIKAIIAGQCDVGIVNTYYYGRLLRKQKSIPVALYWPNQRGRGVHVNVSGAGIVKYARHPKAARKFLEWLSSSQAQNLFADHNMEYPANPKIAPHADVARWGKFKQDRINVSRAGQLKKQAVKLMDRAGYR